MTTTATTATHLRLIVTHWPNLTDALGTPNTITWPPSGLRTYLTAIERADTEETEAARHRDATTRAHEGTPTPLAPSPAPMSVTVYDTMRTVEAALIELADQTAAVVQRSPMAGAPRGWPQADRARRDQLAQADAIDPRRWKYTGRRTAQYAALWLLARVQGAPGPFSPLTPGQEQHIARVAAGAAQRVERTLDLAARKERLDLPCPAMRDGIVCGGRIDIHGGSGASPLAHCTACGRIWADSGVIAA